MNYYCKFKDDADGAVFALAQKGGTIEGEIPFVTYDNVAYFDDEDKIIKYATLDQFSEYILAHSSEWEEVQPFEVTAHNVKVIQLPDDFDKCDIPDEDRQLAGFLGHDPDGKYAIRQRVY